MCLIRAFHEHVPLKHKSVIVAYLCVHGKGKCNWGQLLRFLQVSFAKKKRENAVFHETTASWNAASGLAEGQHSRLQLLHHVLGTAKRTKRNEKETSSTDSATLTALETRWHPVFSTFPLSRYGVDISR